MRSVFVLLVLVIGWIGNGAPEPVPVRMDVNHSNVGFAVPIMGGLSEVRGKFSRFEMDLKYDSEDITRSNVRVRIKAESIDTGIDERDQHLRTSDFFDVEKYPEILFESRRVENKNGQLVLHGTLNMHGVSKEIRLPFVVTGKKVDSEKGTFVMGFKGELILNRREFGIDYSHQSVPGFIGDEVRIEINLLTRSSKLPDTKPEESTKND